MAEPKKRPRLHLDINPDLVRAARAKAGFDGVRVHDVVSIALERYLFDELAIVRGKQDGGANSEKSPSHRTAQERDHL